MKLSQFHFNRGFHIWWFNKTIAPLLDYLWSYEGEIAGYFVTARQP
jgi:hypothetical protein